MNIFKIGLYAFILLLLGDNISIAANTNISDSLQKVLINQGKDTNRVNTLLKLSDYFYDKERNYKSAEHYLESAFLLASEIGYYKGIVIYWDTKGLRHRNHSDYENALYSHLEALNIAVQYEINIMFPVIYNNLGVVYRRLDDYEKGLYYHLKALEWSEKLNSVKSQSMAINSIGNIYALMGNYDKALEYFAKSMKISLDTKNILSIAINYNNIGEVYEFQGKFSKALIYYHNSLEYNKKANSTKGQAICYNCIGNVYKKNNELNKALDYYLNALEIDKGSNDKKYASMSYINVGETYLMMKNYKLAFENLSKGLELAAEIGAIAQIQAANERLSDYYSAINKPDEALKFYKKAAVLKDSVLNEKNAQNIAKLQIVYDYQNQTNQIESLQKEKLQSEKDLKRQRITIFLLMFIAFLTVSFAVVLYRSYIAKKRINTYLKNQSVEIVKQNKILESQNKQIELQKLEIEKKNDILEEANKLIDLKNQKITASLGYARRIQNALLPTKDMISKYFPNHFVLYRPKDIVSGDFYWVDEIYSKIYFAVADCTGHGVPGAFMSFVGINLLNQAINQEKISKPSGILEYLHKGIQNTLRKSENKAVKDGMDIALCSFNPQNMILEYAGALMPLYIIRNNQVFEYKATYTQIGEVDKDYYEPINNQSIKVQSGDSVYLFSDGYMDQFGGEHGKKFLKSRFMNVLKEISTLPMQVQKIRLDNILENWQGSLEQVDDILIMGIKIS